MSHEKHTIYSRDSLNGNLKDSQYNGKKVKLRQIQNTKITVQPIRKSEYWQPTKGSNQYKQIPCQKITP